MGRRKTVGGQEDLIEDLAHRHGARSLARELAAMGSPVRVSVVFPGAVRTGIARELVADAGNATLPINRLLVGPGNQGGGTSGRGAAGAARSRSRDVCDLPADQGQDRASERLKTLLGGKLPVG
jgi:hypothetical protein